MAPEAKVARPQNSAKAREMTGRETETAFVLDTKSEGFKMARNALDSFPQDSLAGLTTEQIRLVFSGSTRDEALAQKDD